MGRTATKAAPRPPDRLLTVPDVMAELKVGRTAVYELIKRGHLRSILVGRYRRVRRSALDAYLDAQERAS